jgi:hypothetical protein
MPALGLGREFRHVLVQTTGDPLGRLVTFALLFEIFRLQWLTEPDGDPRWPEQHLPDRQRLVRALEENRDGRHLQMLEQHPISSIKAQTVPIWHCFCSPFLRVSGASSRLP